MALQDINPPRLRIGTRRCAAGKLQNFFQIRAPYRLLGKGAHRHPRINRIIHGAAGGKAHNIFSKRFSRPVNRPAAGRFPPVALAELRQQRQPNAGLCQQRARGCAEAARNAQGANNDDCWFFAALQQKRWESLFLSL